MYTREQVREMIALQGAKRTSNMVNCSICPYGSICAEINEPDCAHTLTHCNYEYINSLAKREEEEKMIKNTVQINPQGEIEGLGSLSLEDLQKLSAAARNLLEEKTDELEQQLWDNVVKAVKEYCQTFGNIVILLDGDDSLEFNHNQMSCRGEVDCE